MDTYIASQLLLLIRQDQPVPDEMSVETWHSLLGLAQRTDVLALVAARILDLPTAAPGDLRRALENHLRSEARHHGFFFVEAERISDALTAQGIRSVVLKGAGLAPTIYARPEQRSFRDLDILVDPSRRRQAMACVEGLGYDLIGRPSLVETYGRYHFHYIYDGTGKPRLELHWGLARPDSVYHLDPETLLERPVRWPQRGVFCPRPEAQVLHCALNLMRSGFTELKRLVDLDRLLRANPRLDGEWIVVQAHRGGLGPALGAAMELCRDMLGTPAVDPAFDDLLPRRTRAALHKLPVHSFPLALPPSQRVLAPQLVRYHLAEHRWALLVQVLRRPRFERERLRALGVPRWRRELATAKRAVRLLNLALWALLPKWRHHTITPDLVTASSPSNSEPREADRADTPERSS